MKKERKYEIDLRTEGIWFWNEIGLKVNKICLWAIPCTSIIAMKYGNKMMSNYQFYEK